MREAGLGIKPRRRLVRTTDNRNHSPIFPILYDNIIPDHSDRVWVADFAQIRVVAGFCYLAVILDACRRKVIGYALSKRLDTPLVLAALDSAIASQHTPESRLDHADRRRQYASQTYRDFPQTADLRGSMGSVGDPYHNVWAERFMKR